MLGTFHVFACWVLVIGNGSAVVQALVLLACLLRLLFLANVVDVLFSYEP